MDTLDGIDELAQDWLRHLRATNRSNRTITIYRASVEALVDYLRTNGASLAQKRIGRRQLERFIADLMTRTSKLHPDQAISSAYVSQQDRALQQFFRWPEEVEQEVEPSPFHRVTVPKVHEKRVDVLTEDQLAALLATCSGRPFQDRRDLALIRLLLDTGARRVEILGLQVTDLEFEHNTPWVVGKGNKARALGSETGPLRPYAATSVPGHGIAGKLSRTSRPIRCAHPYRCPGSAEPNGSGGWRAERPPAQVPAHLRPPLASRWQRRD